MTYLARTRPILSSKCLSSFINVAYKLNFTGKQQLSELESKLREEKTRNAKLETELAKKQTVPVSDNGIVLFCFILL
jgi:hypothetical protein